MLLYVVFSRVFELSEFDVLLKEVKKAKEYGKAMEVSDCFS